MKDKIKMAFFWSKYIEIAKKLFNVKRTNKKSKTIRIKKNELDYFEDTYITDSLY